LGLVVLSLLVFPGYLVQRSLDATGAPALGPADQLKAENDARTTLLQGIAGLVLVVGAGATWRQLQINREGQITERFNKAIDHLGERGDDRIDVRLGGIYALERIANNSKDDRATIAEILTAYVRGHAAWTTPAEDTDPPDAALDELAELRVRAPDVQAVMTVLGRRALPPVSPSGCCWAEPISEGQISTALTWRGRSSSRPTWRGGPLRRPPGGGAPLRRPPGGGGPHLRPPGGGGPPERQSGGGEPPERQSGGGEPPQRQSGGGGEPLRHLPGGREGHVLHFVAGGFRLGGRKGPHDEFRHAELRFVGSHEPSSEPFRNTLQAVNAAV
jgi:hypothetical protein